MNPAAANAPAGGPAAAHPWRSHPARILRVTPEVPGVQTYDLEFRDPRVRDAYRFQAGQFNMLYLPGIGEAAISISSDAAMPRVLAHTVRAVGNVTDALARLIGHDPHRLGPADQDRVLERRGPAGSAGNPAADGRAAQGAQGAVAAGLSRTGGKPREAPDHGASRLRAVVLELDLPYGSDAAVTDPAGLRQHIAHDHARAEQHDTCKSTET
jgi:hypothetical protein